MLGKQIALNGGMQKATIVSVVEDFHDFSFTEDIGQVFIAPFTSTNLSFSIVFPEISKKSFCRALKKVRLLF
ncbi:MAG TPA: hypothetical protein VFM69_06690 [Pricia sp.]|nr:hypothetical protein [Pricia sp.]